MPDCLCGRPRGACHYTDCPWRDPAHIIEVVTWASNARGPTYAARCSCRWVGATREASPESANQEAAAHLAERGHPNA